MYTSARSPPQHCVPSLAPFLPQGRTTYYPPPPPLPLNSISPSPVRRAGGSKSGRPYSADVSRLLSVQEGSELEEGRKKAKGNITTLMSLHCTAKIFPSEKGIFVCLSFGHAGHRRSSSYGSEVPSQRSGLEERVGSSFQNIPPQEEYYCEYTRGGKLQFIWVQCNFRKFIIKRKKLK